MEGESANVDVQRGQTATRYISQINRLVAGNTNSDIIDCICGSTAELAPFFDFVDLPKTLQSGNETLDARIQDVSQYRQSL